MKKSEMIASLDRMIAEKEQFSKCFDNDLDIAALKRCKVLFQSMMPEQVKPSAADALGNISPMSDLCIKERHAESLRDSEATAERSK
jgi:hypothetical protein